MLGIRSAVALPVAVCLAALTAGVSLAAARAATGLLPPTTCRGEPITILGTPGDDVIQGTTGPDVIHGQAGQDVILGLDGDDLICDDSGSNVLRGGAGDDRLFDSARVFPGKLSGGPGDDLLSLAEGDAVDYRLAAGPVTVDLGAGTAVGEGNDTIVFRSGSFMRVMGSVFDDTLLGGPGGDWFYGNGGADFIDGRGGSDSMTPDNQYVGDDGAVDRVIGGPGGDGVNLNSGGGPT